MIVYVIANRPSAEKIVDGRIYYTYEDAKEALNKLDADIRTAFNIYSVPMVYFVEMFEEDFVKYN